MSFSAVFLHCREPVIYHLLSTRWCLKQFVSEELNRLAGKSHGRRSLKGCSPWGRWGSDTTDRLHFHFSLSCIGEGNGNPLQCPCLENPRDWGAWWAAVYTTEVTAAATATAETQKARNSWVDNSIKTFAFVLTLFYFCK